MELKYKKNRKIYGKYRAFVRDNHDPARLGRLRLEIPEILGTGEQNWSNWAVACLSFGGMSDMGTFLIPSEDATV